MGDLDKRPTSLPKLHDTILEATGSVAGAGLGLVLGGPAGAILGAGAGPLVEYAAKAAKSLFMAFYSRFREDLAGTGTSEDDFLKAIDDIPERKRALLSLMHSAADANEKSQIEFIAHTIASLKDSDARRSKALQEIGAIISRLSLFQLDVLLFINESSIDQELGTTPDQLIEKFDIEKPLIRSAVRNLELYGLIADANRTTPQVDGIFWNLTDLGKWLCQIWSDAHPPESKN